MKASLADWLDNAQGRWLALAPRDRKSLTLLAIILALAGLYVAVCDPLLHAFQEIDIRREALLAKKRQAGEQAALRIQRQRKYDQLSAEYSALKRQVHLRDNGYLDLPRVLEVIETLAHLSGVSISQLTPKEKHEQGDHLETPVDIAYSGSVESVRRFLYFLETSEEVFNLTNLSMLPGPNGDTLEAKISLVKLSLPQDEKHEGLAGHGETLVLGLYPKASNIPFFVAEAKGWLKNETGEVVLKQLDYFKAAEMYLISGDMRAINTSLYSLPYFRNAGVDLRGVLVLNWGAPQLALVVSPHSKIADVRDLKGKTVYVQAAQYHHILYKLLEKNGVPLDSVHTENLTQGMLRKALTTGIVEVALLTKDEPTDQYKTLACIDVSPTDAVWIVAVGAELLQGEGASLVQLLVDGFEKGLAWWREHPDEGLALASKRMGVAPKLLRHQLTSAEFPSSQQLADFFCGSKDKEPGIVHCTKEMEAFYRAFWKRDVHIPMDSIMDWRFMKSYIPCEQH
ncbi:hypothetical protein DFW101_1058 [Solidesulfovibrio carbinoliphilus subsp. oakridgensis]|uniref:SsuA/THI5-like domain-containing protein n=1 Tax=Solidesulfovibrio carbinoliphilus subsp. oakridgensis TaxID=694327 RepID=G7Q653_9BACT|nr:type 4a pilus biogenesis protein PilO [Solidesulfovibrio carbinoliphilus]EHJ47069.1 hypothetical protein DFW101_1058 [Solidesulfovibrio carbinoliphilus subsp. oakridgensis]